MARELHKNAHQRMKMKGLPLKLLADLFEENE
jgi:hypothetical protein